MKLRPCDLISATSASLNVLHVVHVPAAAQAERLRAQERRRHDEARQLGATAALLRARTVEEAEAAVAGLRR